MQAAAYELKFELAAKLRDKISELENTIFSKASTLARLADTMMIK